MKKLIMICAALSLVLSSCWKEEEHSADYSRRSVSALEAVAADGEVILSWTMAEGWSPVEYVISYNDDKQNTVTKHTGNNQTSYTVTDLVNGVSYVFSVQALYEGGHLSGAEQVSATPVSSRLPVEDLTLTAGSKQIAVSWTLPQSDLITGIKVSWIPAEGGLSSSVTLPGDAESYTITELTDHVEYTVSVEALYEKGASVPVTSNATPVSGAPLCSVAKENIYNGEEDTFTFNLEDYPTATNIKWTFQDGTVLTGPVVTNRIWGAGSVVVTLSADIDGVPSTYKIYLTVREFFISFKDWKDSGLKFKNAIFVFSPDGKTAYTVSYGSARHLVAFDLISGSLKWEKDLGGGEGNGCWIAVNPSTGDIIVSSDTKLYAIKDNGESCSEVWTIGSFGLSTGVGAAFSPDASVIYIGNADKKFFTVKASDGTILGSTDLTANVASILVDNNTVLVTVRGSEDPNIYFFDVTNPAEISAIKTLHMPTRASDICSASVSPDKKTAYISADQYFHAINLETKTISASLKFSEVDNYLTCGSVVASSGDVYVVYAEAASQSQMACISGDLKTIKWKWAPESHKNTFNYSCPTLDSEGNAIISDRTGNLWSVDPTGNATKIYSGGLALQSAPGMCGNFVFTMHNVAPGTILSKCIETTRGSLWCGPGGDPCCTKCIQWVFKAAK